MTTPTEGEPPKAEAPKKGLTVKRVGNFELGKMLGQGSFSQVRYAVDVTTGKPYGIKVIEKSLLVEQHLEGQLQREVSIMKEIKHKNVISLHQVMRTGKNIYIVLELVEGGELNDLLQASGRLLDNEARDAFRQLIAGLAFVHKHGIAHRDLKPENLLLTKDQVLKISDFGLANLQATSSNGSVETLEMLHTRCGTPSYVAPEVLTQPGYNGFMADIWSCGVILFMMLSGRLPFVANDIPHLYKKIQRAEYRMSSVITESAADLIRHILVPKPKDRYTIPDIFNHPWFQEDMSEEERLDFAGIFQKSDPKSPPTPATDAVQSEPDLSPAARSRGQEFCTPPNGSPCDPEPPEPEPPSERPPLRGSSSSASLPKLPTAPGFSSTLPVIPPTRGTPRTLSDGVATTSPRTPKTPPLNAGPRSKGGFGNIVKSASNE